MMHSKRENPFMSIIPREQDNVFGRSAFFSDLKSGTEQAINGEKILVIEGDPGTGKSAIMKKLQNLLEKNKIKVFMLDFAGDVLNEVRSLPVEKGKEIFVMIDRFELIDSMKEYEAKKLLELIIEFSEQGLTFLLATTDEGLKTAKKLSNEFSGRTIAYHLPMLDYKHAKKMVVDRLNSVREKESESTAPFTDDELRQIWKKSGGNPRMMLMLCASLYEQKR